VFPQKQTIALVIVLFLILIAVVILTSIWHNALSSKEGVPTLLVFML